MNKKTKLKLNKQLKLKNNLKKYEKNNKKSKIGKIILFKIKIKK